MEHVDELIAGQALHALSADDEERVALHVAECDRCRRQLREAEAIAASLAYAVPRRPPAARSARAGAGGRRAGRRGRAGAPAPRPAPQPARRSRLVAADCRRRRAGAGRRRVGLLVWNVSLRGDLSSTHQLAHGAAGDLRGVGTVVVEAGRQRDALRRASRPAPAGQDLRGVGDPRQGGAPGGHVQGRRHRER